jgi:F-type H+-transporting ATPase subunit epsilon
MTIRLDVVTVERLVYSEDVDMVVIPGSEGVFGVLPNHAPLLSAMNYGEMIIRRKEEEEQLFAISGGFVEVQPDKVTVLADAAERADEISIERAQSARDRAKGLLEQARNNNDIDLIRAEASLRRALVRLKIAEKRRRHS